MEDITAAPVGLEDITAAPVGLEDSTEDPVVSEDTGEGLTAPDMAAVLLGLPVTEAAAAACFL